jgi:hypothetical protein
MDDLDANDRLPPLVLLDVDGVINYFDAVLAVRIADDPEAMAKDWDVDMIESHGLLVAIPRYKGELVRALAAASEVWWCTTWPRRAKDEIAAHFGIQPLPVIDVAPMCEPCGGRRRRHEDSSPRRRRRGGPCFGSRTLPGTFPASRASCTSM